MIIFQIPVYAESAVEYHDWLESKMAPHIEAAGAAGRSEASGRAQGLSIHGTSWLYNRVVGWIEVDAAPDVVKFYYVGPAQERVRRDRREPFDHGERAKLAEVWVDEAWAAPEPWSAIEREVTHISSQDPLRRRWIDRSAFDAVGPYLDFAGLFGWSR